MVEGYVDLEYFELPILIWNLMLAVCIVCKYEANFRELQRMSGIAHCSVLTSVCRRSWKSWKRDHPFGCERIRHLHSHQKGTGGVESARDVDGHALEPLEHIMQLAGSKMTNICICRLM